MNGMPETPFPFTPSGAITAILTWHHYGDPDVAPLWRSSSGSICPITNSIFDPASVGCRRPSAIWRIA